MKTKKIKKWIGWVILIVILIAVVFVFNQRPNEGQYNSVTAERSDLITYYSFSGNIEPKNKQSIVATSMFQVDEILVEEGDDVSESQLLLTATQGTEFESELDGEISNIYIEEGDVVMAGAPLIDVTDYNHLQVKVKVDEYDIQAVQLNKEVTVKVNALDKEIKGTISKVSKEAQTLNGISFFVATIDLEPDQDLFIGMSTEVKLVNQSVSNAIVLPMSSLQFDEENKPYVYYRDSKGEVVTKSVEVGITDGVNVEVLSGVEEQEEILVPKTFKFTSPMEMMRSSK